MSKSLVNISEHDFIRHDLRGMLDNEGLFVMRVFSSLSVLILSFLLSAVVFPKMGLTINGVYKERTR